MRYSAELLVAGLQPSPQLIAFVKRQIRNSQLYTGPERRCESRQLVMLSVVVIPIDERMNPLGPPLAMVTQSMSTDGIGLVHEEPILHDRIALKLVVDGEQEFLTGHVCWRRPLGPFHMCGCKVIGKLDQFPDTLTELCDLLTTPDID